jgi:hypothetical protein
VGSLQQTAYTLHIDGAISGLSFKRYTIEATGSKE